MVDLLGSSVKAMHSERSRSAQMLLIMVAVRGGLQKALVFFFLLDLSMMHRLRSFSEALRAVERKPN